MAHLQLVAGDEVAHLLRQLEQAQRVGHRRAVLADPLRQLLLRVAELVDEPLVGLGLFDRVEVLALQVLDERELVGLALLDVLDDDRDWP